VESATLENGLATVHLTGQFVLGGVCDNPRFQSQLEYTVLQFPGVEAVEIYINNQPLSDLLTGEG
jgi:spore germination protein GerM